MEPLHIIFAGTPAFGLPCLQAIADAGHIVEAVYTQPDRPSGRGRAIQLSPIKEWANHRNIAVFQPLNFKDSSSIEQMATLKPDVLIVIAYGLILPAAVLDIPRLGCVNVHASILPRWRGASPIIHSLLAGDEMSGVSIMKMDVGMDTGPVYTVASCEISEQETAHTLHDKLSLLAVTPLLKTISLLQSGQALLNPQNSEKATYAPKISKEMARIDWNMPAEVIERHIRAYNPIPIAYFHSQNEIIRIHQAEVKLLGEDMKPGTLVSSDKNGLVIACARHALRIQSIQLAGGKVLSVRDCFNSPRYVTLLSQPYYD